MLTILKISKKKAVGEDVLDKIKQIIQRKFLGAMRHSAAASESAHTRLSVHNPFATTRAGRQRRKTVWAGKGAAGVSSPTASPCADAFLTTPSKDLKSRPRKNKLVYFLRSEHDANRQGLRRVQA